MSSQNPNSRLTIIVAWIAVLLASSLGVIFWRELAGEMPFWWPWLHVAGLVAIFALTFVRQTLGL